MRGRRLGFLLVVPVLMGLIGSTPALAALYGLSSSNPGTLYTVNPGDGSATAVTDLSGSSFVSLTGLSFLDGTLFGTDIVPPGASFMTGTIDTGSGAFVGVSNQDGSANWHGLASDEAAALLYTIDINDSNKLKSMTAGGVVTTIGTGAGIDGRGMAFDDVNDILYATGSGSLYTVNTATGASTLVGGMQLDTGLIGLAYDEIADILYANVAGTGLYTINVGTGDATFIGSNGTTAGSGIDGLAWLGPQGPDVPEPGTLALAMLAVGAIAGLKKRLS